MSYDVSKSISDTSRSVTDDSRVMLQIVVSLTDYSRGVINMFIVQATGIACILTCGMYYKQVIIVIYNYFLYSKYYMP